MLCVHIQITIYNNTISLDEAEHMIYSKDKHVINNTHNFLWCGDVNCYTRKLFICINDNIIYHQMIKLYMIRADFCVY